MVAIQYIMFFKIITVFLKFYHTYNLSCNLFVYYKLIIHQNLLLIRPMLGIIIPVNSFLKLNEPRGRQGDGPVGITHMPTGPSPWFLGFSKKTVG